MRKLLQIILLKPVLWASKKFASRPGHHKIFKALSELYKHIPENPGKKGIVLNLHPQDRVIIFSDQHKGAKNGADDFMKAEPNYLNALNYYHENGFQFINLGDCEELWKNSLGKVKKHNGVTFEAEKKFIQQNRFYKILGNHDLLWTNDPLGGWHLKRIYGQEVKVYEGLILQLTIGNSPLTIFLTHGHQGDASSDGNWFSKFFVARIWAPLQAFLKINPNTPAYDHVRKTEHNNIMYEWSAEQKNLLLITGHTHQPVFESLTHLERLYKELLFARQTGNADEAREREAEIRQREKQFKSVSVNYRKMKPSYFNTGCCCFADGDITGIEIEDRNIFLVKWGEDSGREILAEASLSELQYQLN